MTSPELSEKHDPDSPPSVTSASDASGKDEVYALAAEVSSSLEDTEYPTRRVDLHILPWLCGIYLLQFLDKSLLNYAAAMGIKENLHGSQFANLSTMFYGAYIAGEPVMAYAMQRWSLSKSLGVFVCCWGVVVACHCACTTYAQLMVVRTLLGIFESSSAVGLIYISSMWYSKKSQAARMGLWSSMAGVATIIGALLSFGFQYIHSPKFASWQILFLVMGVITCAFGVGVFWWLPDNVATASWLTSEQKYAVVAAIKANQTGSKCHVVKRNHIAELLWRDPLTWPYFFNILISQIVTGAIGTFSVTVTMSFGFTNKTSALLQIPVGALIIIVIMTSTLLVQFGGYMVIIITMLIPSVVGAIVLLCPVSKYGQLFGLYLLYSGSSSITLFYAWTMANTGGSTKKFARNVMTMVAFSVACIIGPQLFTGKTYTAAKIVLLVTQSVAIPMVLGIGYMCHYLNRNRQREATGEYSLLDITDRENPEFVYKY
ncbi:hypothetical protein DIURU_003220 [Diutina rugosa]|uniref:Major facilitator superfamily (MFS) profile domain-containing protein n=1 Tax=Diutina rugosa TaxID=5481 RepID=A0A642ULP2_DIURU|nr:uncharacterized protein DIURU_003220 [Diutina rugosa]KAA8901511.1 hypothetical protein DIURU_003220 [Diutina rugosa]